jgi:hypothetical protein
MNARYQYGRAKEIHSDTDTFFRDRAGDGGALHLALGVHDDTSIILQYALGMMRHSSWIETHLKVEK